MYRAIALANGTTLLTRNLSNFGLNSHPAPRHRTNSRKKTRASAAPVGTELAGTNRRD